MGLSIPLLVYCVTDKEGIGMLKHFFEGAVNGALTMVGIIFWMVVVFAICYWLF